jgi:hypothetical protein
VSGELSEDVRQLIRFAVAKGIDPKRTVLRFLRKERDWCNYLELTGLEPDPERASRMINLEWLVSEDSPFTFHQRYCLFLIDSLGSIREATAYLHVDRTNLTNTLRAMLSVEGMGDS